MLVSVNTYVVRCCLKVDVVVSECKKYVLRCCLNVVVWECKYVYIEVLFEGVRVSECK